MSRTRFVLWFVWAALTFLIHEVIVFALFILPGYLITLATIATSRLQAAPWGTPRVLRNPPRALWVWGNDEDGLDPMWWQLAHPTWSPLRRMWVWAAWRNPANNLRFIKWAYPPPEVGRVQNTRRGSFTIVRQGWRCRIMYYRYHGAEWVWFAMGWKYEVTDGMFPCTDWRVHGCGFGARLVRS